MVGEDDTPVLVDEKGSRDGGNLVILGHSGFPIARVEKHKKAVLALVQIVENALCSPLDIDAHHLEALPAILLM